MLRISAALAAVSSATIQLSWQDCGDASTHGHITGLEPTSFNPGDDVTIKGTGTLDEAVSGGNFKLALSASGVLHQTYTGDICAPKTFNLPLNLGSIGWGGMTCPVAKGTLTVPLTLKLSSKIPQSLANGKVDSTVTASNGDKLACINAQFKKQFAASDASFEHWMQQFGKTYNGEDEMQKREQIFNDNMAFIEAENAKGHSYTLGWTPFTDMTHDEFKAGYLGYSAPSELFEGAVNLGNHEYNGEDLAASVDWRSKGAVTPVKNQGQCGSCWSFSTTGGLEGAWELHTNNLVSLSEQQFVDCDKSSNGCGGGSMAMAFNWAKSQALCTEESYPYEAKDGSCRASGCTVGVARGDVTGYKNVGLFGIVPATEQQMMSAISQQPVSVAIEADQASFQHYKSGVLTAACGTKLDHGVLAVGYDSESWLVKNSWGPQWGDSGYVRLAKAGDQCGILNMASYPVVGGSVAV